MPDDETTVDPYFAGMTEKQKKIYESALEAFAEKGFSGASTGEIARKAGVAEGLIFKHFKNKKQLFQKIAFMVVERTLLPLTVQRTKVILSDDYSDLGVFLKLFFAERLDFINKHKTFLRIIIQEISFDNELQIFAKDQFNKHMLPMATDFIKRHQAKGVLLPLKPTVILRMVMSSLMGYAMLRFIISPDDQWDDVKQIQTMIDILQHGLIAKKP